MHGPLRFNHLIHASIYNHVQTINQALQYICMLLVSPILLYLAARLNLVSYTYRSESLC